MLFLLNPPLCSYGLSDVLTAQIDSALPGGHGGIEPAVVYGAVLQHADGTPDLRSVPATADGHTLNDCAQSVLSPALRRPAVR